MPYEVFEDLVAIVEGVEYANFPHMEVHLKRMDEILALRDLMIEVAQQQLLTATDPVVFCHTFNDINLVGDDQLSFS